MPEVQTLQDTVQEQCCILASEGCIQPATGRQGVPSAAGGGLDSTSCVGVSGRASAHRIASCSDTLSISEVMLPGFERGF